MLERFADRAWLAIVLIAVLTALSQIHPIWEPDLWWHMWVGEQMVDHGFWAYPDHSSFTQDGWTYVNAEWLPSIVLWLAWVIAGPAGPTLLTALGAAAGVLVVGLLTRRLAPERPWLAVAACALIAGMTFERWAARPHLFFLTLLPLGLLVLELPAGRRRLLALIGLQLLWSHCHGSHVLLPGLVGARAIGWWLRDGRAGLREGVISVGVLGLMSLLVGPQGPGTLAHVLHHASSDSVSHIGEMRSPTWADLMPSELGGVAWLWLVVVAVIVLAMRRRPRLDDLLVGLAGVALQYTAVRFHAAMGILLLPLLLRREGARPASWPRAELAVALLLVLLTVPNGWRKQAQGAPWGRPGLGVWEDGVPVDAADLLEAHGASGHVWNYYDDGGYLIWRLAPQLKFAIDGRSPAFHTVDHHGLWRQSKYSVATFRGMDARWGIDHALVDRDLPLCGRLEGHPDWRLVHVDARRALFTKADGPFLPEHALVRLPACASSPLAGCPDSQQTAAAMWDETSALLALEPDAHYPWVLRMRLLSCSEGTDPAAALPVVQAAVDGELFADDLARAALMTLNAGDPDGALALLDRARELGAEGRIELLRGRVLASMGQPERAAEAMLEAAVQLDDAMMNTQRLEVAWACRDAGMVTHAAEHALRVAATGNPDAVALLRELEPQLEGQQADDARGWLEAWER